MNDIWTIYTDGGSRGNPGPAAYAYVIKRPNVADIEERGYLGHTTNNIAEYTGLVKALEHARVIGGKKLLVNCDSELLVKQMNGQYKVKNEGLRPLYLQAVALRKQFDSVTIKHIYREQNSQADALCNEAMDNPRDYQPRTFAACPSDPDVTEDVPSESCSAQAADAGGTPLMRSLDLLRQSARLWVKSGDANDPAPVDILNQIIAILARDVAD